MGRQFILMCFTYYRYYDYIFLLYKNISIKILRRTKILMFRYFQVCFEDEDGKKIQKKSNAISIPMTTLRHSTTSASHHVMPKPTTGFKIQNAWGESRSVDLMCSQQAQPSADSFRDVPLITDLWKHLSNNGQPRKIKQQTNYYRRTHDTPLNINESTRWKKYSAANAISRKSRCWSIDSNVTLG